MGVSPMGAVLRTIDRYAGRYSKSGAIFRVKTKKNAPLVLIRPECRPTSKRTAIMGEPPMVHLGPPNLRVLSYAPVDNPVDETIVLLNRLT